MKILYFTKYSRNAGSSRLRSYQYFPFLREKGMRITVKPLFSERYLTKLYAGGPNKLEALKGYIHRFFVLFTVWRFDLIVVEKELFPYLPAWFEQLFGLFGVKYVADYDDAIFHNYDKHPNRWVRRCLGDKIDTVMRSSVQVIAGNTYLAERAKRAGAKYITVIPTVIDITRYPEKVWPAHCDRLIVGWIGTKSTFEKHFMLLSDNVRELTEKYTDIQFHIVGAPDNGLFNNKVKFITWTEESEVEEILKFDVGLMPLLDTDWEKGKCAYKLIQYMACGIPGIASAVGANIDVVDTNNGFLAETLGDFAKIIEEIRENPAVLQEKGKQARQDVWNKYTLQVQQRRLWHTLQSVR